MSKLEIFIGGHHHVHIPGLGILSGKIEEKIGDYFLCSENSMSSKVFYLISASGKAKVFPLNSEDVIHIDQYFTDGILMLEDKTQEIPKMILFQSYEVKDNSLLLIDAVHNQQLIISIN